MKNIQSNFWKLYIASALRWSMFAIPIIVLFYQQNGLSLKQVLVLQAVFALIATCFEIPTGHFSDRLSRKTSIVLGLVLGFIGYLTYSFSYGFWGFLFAEVLLGVGASFISGADSALIYETLAELGKQGEYKKYEGKILSSQNFAEGLASIAGGFLAVISLRLPIYFETAAVFLAIPLALTLVEPVRTKIPQIGSNFSAMLKVIRFSLREHTEIKWLIIYSAIVSSATLTMVWFIQPYLKLVGLPLIFFGIVWAAYRFVVAASSLLASRLEAFFGRSASLISLVALVAGAYFLTSYIHSLWGAAILVIFHIVYGLNEPITKDYINILVDSNVRATVLSVRSMLGRIIFAVIGPFIGWASDAYSLSYALTMAGIIFLVLGIIPLLFLNSHGLLSGKTLSSDANMV